MSKESLKNNFQQKILNFIQKNLKKLIVVFILFVIFFLAFTFYANLKKQNEIKISAKYTQASIQFKQKKITESKLLLESIIAEDHKFYSPLALYFIIDNNLETDSLKIVNFFDKILKNNSIEEENINLIKIKKAIFLFSKGNEESIIKTLNPIINSNSVWKNMAISLISDYFLSQDQKKKADEYIQLLDNKIKK